MIEILKDFLHNIGLHNWYYSTLTRERACIRCGIVQYKGNLTNKWKVR